jgi:hypothetical protein
MDPRHDRRLAAQALTLSSLTFMIPGPVPDASEGTEPQRRRFELAMSRYERCHWHQAFTLLAMLADEGHAQASRMALLMHSHGPTMYGLEFPAERARRERWLAAVSLAARPAH